MTLNVVALLESAARRFPDRIAVSDRYERISFLELQDRARRFGDGLRGLGVAPGDRVLVGLGNSPDFPVVYYGALGIGAVVVPVNPLMPPRDVEHYVRDAEPVVAVVAESFGARFATGVRDAGSPSIRTVVSRDESRGTVDADPQVGVETVASVISRSVPTDSVRTQGDDLAVIIYTSGTTGRPKGASLSHLNLVSNAHQMAGAFGWHEREPETVLGVPPLFHSIGQSVIMNTLFTVAGRVHLVDRFDVEVHSEALVTERVTALIGVPSMLAAFAAEQERAGRDLSALTLAVSGGSPLAPETRATIDRSLGVQSLQVYGLSETSPLATAGVRGETAPPTSVGRPLWGVEVAIRDGADQEVQVGEIGELCIRGHVVMQGYWRRPEATAEAIDAAGWFRSGDLGHVDADGHVFIVDRKKHMIIRNGFNVYPREIEDCLLEMPDVLHAAVVGVPDDKVGEEVAAFVVAKPDRHVDVADVTEWLHDKVAPQKRPRRVEVLEEMPMTPTGKILKSALQSAASATDEAAAAL